MSAAQLKRFVSLLHNAAIVTMHQTDPDRDRGRAAADTCGTGHFGCIIERCEAARSRYLTRLSESSVRSFTRHRNQRLVNVIELRLAHLRAHRRAWKEPARLAQRS
jgi:hypothetical protein